MRRHVTFLFACAVPVLLAGCLGPRPITPAGAAVTAPTAWRQAAGSDSVSLDWWTQFGDPLLTRLIERALQNNTDIGQAIARVDQARALANFVDAQEFPIANIGVSGTQSRTIVLGAGIDQLAGQPQVTASYDVDLFGRYREATEAARATLISTAAARDAVNLAVAGTTASTYFALLGMDARLATLKATVETRENALRLARRLAGAGYSSSLELHQAESEYQGAVQLVPAAELAISKAENALSILVGDLPGAIDRDIALDQMQDPVVPGGLPSSLLRRRPDLVAAEQALVASDHSIDSARAALLPDLSLTGAGGVVFSTALLRNISVYSLGVGIFSPLFDAGRLRDQVDLSAGKRDEAAYAYRKAALNAFREVDDALASIQRLGEQGAAIRAQIVPLQETYRISQNRYRAGYSPYIDQVDAQRSLLAAQLTEIQVDVDRLTAYVALFQALGGGWYADGTGPSVAAAKAPH